MSYESIKFAAAHRRKTGAIAKLSKWGKEFTKHSTPLEDLEVGWSKGGAREIQNRLRRTKQKDEFATSIPESMDIFSPPQSPVNRRSRYNVMPSTPPKLRLPSASQHARSRPGQTNATTRSRTNKSKTKAIASAIDLDSSGDDNDVPRRPSGGSGGGEEPPDGPPPRSPPGKPRKKKKKKRRTTSSDESDEKESAADVAAREKEKKRKERVLERSRQRIERQKEKKEQQKQARKFKRQLKKQGQIMKPYSRLGLSSRAYLAIRKRQKGIAKKQLDMLGEGQKKNREKSLTEQAFSKTLVGKRLGMVSRAQAAIARAKLHKQKAAQFRSAKRHSRGHYSGHGIKNAKLQIKEQGPGVFLVRSTGMSDQVQKHVRLLLDRVSGKITVNGQPMNKKDAFKMIIQILSKRQSALVKIVS